MQKKILLTRPRGSGERWASLLTRHGYVCMVEPLLTLAPTNAPRPAGQFQAVMITSANALDALAEFSEKITDLLALPCFCVGASTLEAARAFGFTITDSGAGDGAALARKIAASLTEKHLPILHIAGDIVDPKAQDLLTREGFTVALWPVYQATAAEDFTPAASAAFAAGEIEAVPVFSPRSARILVSIIEKNRLARACHAVTAIALSQQVADVLQTLPWRRLHIARHPREEEILACLQSEKSMTESATETAPAPPSAARPSEKRAPAAHPLLWTALGGAVIACVLFLAPISDPRRLLAPRPPETAAPQTATANVTVTHDNESPAAPVATTATTTSIAATPETAPATADALALAGKIANLQNQIAQLREQTQKTIAGLFAFMDLRDAARQGQAFADQLDVLRAAASADAVASEQIGRLEPYAPTGAPSVSQLRDELIRVEASIQLPDTTPSQNASLLDRVKAAAGHLISVHPAHDPAFAPLEQALATGDAQGALELLALLPPDTQTRLENWKQKLESRIAIDAALRALTAHYAAPLPDNAAPGSRP